MSTGSGAGLNRIGQLGGVFLLRNVNANVSAVAATPPTPPAYGTFGINDSGIVMWEGIGFSKWVFQILQVGATAASGYSFTLYGTISRGVYTAKQAGRTGAFTASTNPDVQPVNWFQIPAPSEQVGTGIVANPLTAVGQVLYCSLPLVAVRAVLTASATPLGTVDLLGFAVP